MVGKEMDFFYVVELFDNIYDMFEYKYENYLICVLRKNC